MGRVDMHSSFDASMPPKTPPVILFLLPPLPPPIFGLVLCARSCFNFLFSISPHSFPLFITPDARTPQFCLCLSPAPPSCPSPLRPANSNMIMMQLLLLLAKASDDRGLYRAYMPAWHRLFSCRGVPWFRGLALVLVWFCTSHFLLQDNSLA